MKFTPYGAFWFLHEHPAFNLPLRAKTESENTKGTRFTHTTKDPDGTIWGYMKTTESAMEKGGLDIYYAMVDSTGTVNDDKSLNTNPEVWLEFGPYFYGLTSGTDTPLGEWDAHTYEQHIHDIRLDVGAKTFDKALIKLAKKVLKHYGDYDRKV